MTQIDLQRRYLQCVTFMITKLKMYVQGFRDYYQHYQALPTGKAADGKRQALAVSFQRSLMNFKKLIHRFQALKVPVQYQQQHKLLVSLYQNYVTNLTTLAVALADQKETASVEALQQRCQQSLVQIRTGLTTAYQLKQAF